MNNIEKDQLLENKLNYLNGFLMALSFINSYSVVGMNYELFHFSLNENIKKTIQVNSYDLFGVKPYEWEIELIREENWDEKLKEEFYSNFKRRIPIYPNKIQFHLDYSENDFVKDLTCHIKLALNYFIDTIRQDFIKESTVVYELKVIKGGFYRLLGIDLVFQIDSTDIIVLQLYGTD